MTGTCLLLLLLSAALRPCAAAHAGGQEDQDERLIGWKELSYGPPPTAQQWIETISWSPRAFVWHGFLSADECKHLIKVATPLLTRSLVVAPKGGEALDPIRTSYSGSLVRGMDPVVRGIEERASHWTKLPSSYGEPIEVLRYHEGQKYDAHWDWFHDESTMKLKKNRAATVLMYLADLEPSAGGETALPLAEVLDGERQQVDGLSPCAAGHGLAVRPRRGDALLFWDMLPDGQSVDRRALHASCPVIGNSSTKYTATLWVHNEPYA